jgi:hypothetical protein
MNEHRTTSILQRVPVILAVTAASYGLPSQAQASRWGTDTGKAPSGAANASAFDRTVRETVALSH